LRVAGNLLPSKGLSVGSRNAQQVLSGIKESSSAILFVALGAHFQEFFSQDHNSANDIPVAVGIGREAWILSPEFQARRANSEARAWKWAFRLGGRSLGA